MSRDLAREFDGPTSSSAGGPTAVVVALGANLGDRGETIASAVEALARLPLTEVTAVADTIESVALTPDGPDPSAPPYLNSVVLLSTRLAPSVLLDYLHAIEERHGRPRRTAGGPRWQDRTLDLDLIAYGEVRSNAAGLTLPHPRAAEREFVLEPWLSVDPDAVLPGSGEVAVLLRALRERSVT